jgi:hypothetical protein
MTDTIAPGPWDVRLRNIDLRRASKVRVSLKIRNRWPLFTMLYSIVAIFDVIIGAMNGFILFFLFVSSWIILGCFDSEVIEPESMRFSPLCWRDIMIILPLSLAMVFIFAADGFRNLGGYTFLFSQSLVSFAVGYWLSAILYRHLQQFLRNEHEYFQLWSDLKKNPLLTETIPDYVYADSTAHATHFHQNLGHGNKARNNSIVFGGLGILIVVLARFSNQISQISSVNSIYWWLFAFGGMIIGLINSGFVSISTKAARQHLAPNIDFVLQNDKRPPVLFLRSFSDDSLKTKTGRLEEQLQQAAMERGPFIAIGAPADALPPDGAYRDYVDEDQWQRRVIDLMARAAIILILPGTSKWIEWEIDNILNRGMLAKTTIVFPPLSGSVARQERYNTVKRRLEKSKYAKILNDIDVKNLVMLRFGENIVTSFTFTGTWFYGWEFTFRLAGLIPLQRNLRRNTL